MYIIQREETSQKAWMRNVLVKYTTVKEMLKSEESSIQLASVPKI